MSAPAAPAERLDAAILAAAAFAVAAWGATPMVTKLAVAGLDGLAVGLLRTLLAGALALPVLLLGRLDFPATWRARGLLAVSALGGFVLFPLLFSLGQSQTTAAHGALILAILPVLTGLIAAVTERRWPAGRWWLGAAIAGLGTVILVSGRFELFLAGADPLGDLLVLLAAVSASGGYVAGAHAARLAGTWAVTFWGLVLGGLVLLPLSPVLLSGERLSAAGPAVWSCLVYLAAVSSIVAYAAWYWALSRGGVARIGLIQYFQPLVGLILAVTVLGEVLSWPVLVSAFMIIGGVVLAGRSGTPRKSSQC